MGPMFWYSIGNMAGQGGGSDNRAATVAEACANGVGAFAQACVQRISEPPMLPTWPLWLAFGILILIVAAAMLLIAMPTKQPDGTWTLNGGGKGAGSYAVTAYPPPPPPRHLHAVKGPPE